MSGKEIAHILPSNVIVINAENNKKEQTVFTKTLPIIIKNTYQKELIEEVKFPCKGRHQYKEIRINEELSGGTLIKSSWICKCGKIL